MTNFEPTPGNDDDDAQPTHEPPADRLETTEDELLLLARLGRAIRLQAARDNAEAARAAQREEQMLARLTRRLRVMPTRGRVDVDRN